MRNRTLALLTLLAGLTIGGLLLHERGRDAEPAEVGSPVAPAEVGKEVELIAAEPVRAPVGLVEDPPAEPSARTELPVLPRVAAIRPGAPDVEPVETVLVFRALDETGPVVREELSVSTSIRSRRGYSRAHGAVHPGVQTSELALRLRPQSIPRTTNRKEVADDGHFQLVGLPPGTYAFSVVVAERDVLVEVPGIEVEPGEITQDPRLAALDLRRRLHVFTIDLVPPSPSLAIRGEVSFTEAGTSGLVRSKFFRESPVVVVTPLSAIDVLVRARDCRIERLSAIAERTEVRLRPCLIVRLALPRGIHLPAPPLYVGAMLEREGTRPEERTQLPELGPTSTFDTNGEMRCQALEPGRHIVRWFVERRRGERSGSTSSLGMTFEQVVVVEDRAGEQRIKLALTNKALTAALAAR